MCKEKYGLPENPPNVETHDVQPEEARQEGELNDERCNH